MFGVDVHTIGPNSQGYLTLGAGIVVGGLDLPDDPADERWAHLLIESAKLSGFDRPGVLHEHADGDALLDLIRGRRGLLDTDLVDVFIEAKVYESILESQDDPGKRSSGHGHQRHVCDFDAADRRREANR